MTVVGILLLIVAGALEFSVVPVAVNTRTLASGLAFGYALFVLGAGLAVLGLHLIGAF